MRLAPSVISYMFHVFHPRHPLAVAKCLRSGTISMLVIMPPSKVVIVWAATKRDQGRSETNLIERNNWSLRRKGSPEMRFDDAVNGYSAHLPSMESTTRRRYVRHFLVDHRGNRIYDLEFCRGPRRVQGASEEGDCRVLEINGWLQESAHALQTDMKLSGDLGPKSIHVTPHGLLSI
jgi:hypothetical protein